MNLHLSDISKGQKWFICKNYFNDMVSKTRSMLSEPEKFAGMIQAFSAQKISNPLFNNRNGVAEISITGPLVKKSGFITMFFGGTSYNEIRAATRQALEDDSVNSIMLRVDSPGGTVNGVEDTGNLIYQARQQKPVFAFADGNMLSGAYWLASAASKIYSNQTANIGSIGVLMVHEDWSRYNEQRGINVTYMTAGKYKAIGNPDEPLGETAQSVIQAELDYLYDLFTATVARNREISGDQVKDGLADGRIFIGEQATDIDMIDGIASYENALIEAQNVTSKTFINKQGGEKMEIKNLQELKDAFPELCQQFEDGILSNFEKDKKAVAEGERERILGLAQIQFNGPDFEKFKALINSGVTAEQFAAMKETFAATVPTDESVGADNDQESQSVKEQKAQMLETLKNASQVDVGTSSDSAIRSGEDYMSLVRTYQKENKCDIFRAMQQVSVLNPEARAEYIREMNS